MEINNDKWFEVWYIDGVEHLPAYLVVVAPNPKSPNEIIIVDLQKDEILYQSESYEDIRNWLIEDEFSLVNGRVEN